MSQHSISNGISFMGNGTTKSRRVSLSIDPVVL
jgi:hypothetical protein